jgi:hypothetical protein
MWNGGSPLARTQGLSVTLLRAYRARTAHFRQPLRSLSYHIDPPLQLVLQFGDVHLVRDAIGVADALYIAVLNQFFQTAHYGYARQLQRVGDLTCERAST